MSEWFKQTQVYSTYQILKEGLKRRKEILDWLKEKFWNHLKRTQAYHTYQVFYRIFKLKEDD